MHTRRPVPNRVFGGERVRGLVGKKMCPEQEAKSHQGRARCTDFEGKFRLVRKQNVGQEHMVVSTRTRAERTREDGLQ